MSHLSSKPIKLQLSMLLANQFSSLWSLKTFLPIFVNGREIRETLYSSCLIFMVTIRRYNIFCNCCYLFMYRFVTGRIYALAQFLLHSAHIHRKCICKYILVSGILPTQKNVYRYCSHYVILICNRLNAPDLKLGQLK